MRSQIHPPAAAAWVRTREDARRYITTSAHDIAIERDDGARVLLSDMDEAERAAIVDAWVDRFGRDGWLPHTRADGREAVRKAQQLAAASGGQPFVRILMSCPYCEASIFRTTASDPAFKRAGIAHTPPACQQFALATMAELLEALRRRQ